MTKFSYISCFTIDETNKLYVNIIEGILFDIFKWYINNGNEKLTNVFIYIKCTP